jgi:hypothetical protein
MFDVYTIPMTAPMPLFTKEEIKRFKPNDIKEWIKSVENLFEMPQGRIGEQKKNCGRPMKQTTDRFCISTVRRAIVHHVYQHGTITVEKLGSAIGVNYSNISVMRQDAKNLLEIKDERFKMYLDKIDSIPIYDFAKYEKNCA